MSKLNKKHNNRLKKLVIMCTLCAVVLSVSTYAWFIGMKTVNVKAFEIEIATTEGLTISMDGETWGYTLDPSSAPVYGTNTNVWATDGLIPMSTVGDMDVAASRMILFEKGSLTATSGGYRLLASRVDNHTVTDDVMAQGKGYIAFDLFIKNLSGNEYYTDNNPLNEEAIYLTTNSEVTIGSSGVANTGIENSIRVGFAQIGRVKATTDDVSTITEITCNNKEYKDNVTGICRNAQIWEPNDTKHVTNAINWYNTACVKRKTAGTDVDAKASYEIDASTGAKTACNTITNGTAYPTYAISRIKVTSDVDPTKNDNVNIYDGDKYNGYKANTVPYFSVKEGDTVTTQGYYDATTEQRKTMKLVEFPYFTDTMKNLPTGDAIDSTDAANTRPQFMTLAPNSITKVRVYVWLEGQDIDNYDFASLGQQVSIKFGFTKERFTESDIDYTGPSTDITGES